MDSIIPIVPAANQATDNGPFRAGKGKISVKFLAMGLSVIFHFAGRNRPEFFRAWPPRVYLAPAFRVPRVYPACTRPGKKMP
jgi:hypothetical protein